MRKISVLIVLIGLMVSFQSKAQISYGAEAGLNLSRPIDATSVRPGFRVGVFGEYSFSKLFFLDASLRFNYKPWKNFRRSNSGDNWDPTMLYSYRKYTGNPYSLELPIHAGFRFDIARNVSLDLAVGPYFGVGLGGKCDLKSVFVDTDQHETVAKDEFDIYGKQGFRRFEVGSDARIGVEFNKHYNVSLGYQFQFNEPSDGDMPIGKSQVFSVNFGYRF